MPIQPIVRTVVEYAKNNPKQVREMGGTIVTVFSLMASGVAKSLEIQKNRKKEKLEEGGYSYRKERLLRYKSEIQKRLPDMKKKELFFHLLEVEDIIQSIKDDIDNAFKVNPALVLKKELNKWNNIHQGISSTMDNLDYEELLMYYNDANYKSDYFEGFKLIIETLNKHKSDGDKEKLHFYVKEITNKSMAKIQRDFL
ncbi:hypothetical protein CR194_13100 [Salipaludibacillus keqinensis]|uniref:Uncharacterized protein n=1 Tax=Salipaludibacillus keqinensis TaxID=2045207 RepID=A0A323TAR3_9BACI|nr:hypothetical protein [Salipaludibacillus keqinensis]PYZ92602.1 hypothetical protein CR194_13100 [Salipaludibacillus keqinensis]